jgi:radical SAM superfamily enzyme YgiQ (UPF0313 family)
MKILLISANTEQINMPVLPLGMACVAAAAQNAGHDVNTVNLMMAGDIRSLLKSSIVSYQPDVIGISVRNIDNQIMGNPNFLLDPVKAVVSECRYFSDAPIVLGGAGYSIFPKSALDYLKADMGIQGEGEKSFVSLLERIEGQADLSEVPGLFLPKIGLIKKPVPGKNLDDYPLPLSNVHLPIPSDFNMEEVWFPIQTRRGCAMDCAYCSTASIEGRILRRHSIEYIMDVIRQSAALGIKKYFFVDNTFNFPPSYAKTLCERMIRENIGIEWRCILYPWKVDEDLIQKMARAGCKEVSLGFESGSETMLKRMNKRYTLDDIRYTSDMLGKYQIRRIGFLLLGGPGETTGSVLKSLSFADSLKTEAMKITTGIRIYPHTALHRIAVDDKLVTPDDNLLFPKFYIVKGLEKWLEETVDAWMTDHENWMR